MTAALGYSGVLLGAAAAAALVVTGWQAARSGVAVRRRLARPVLTLLAGAGIAMLALEIALLTDDFSVRYVAEHSARATPLVFKVATAWAALEGSIVLWGLVLAGYTAAVWSRLGRGDGDRLGAAALAVMGAVAVFFFGLMATAANPFQPVTPVPPDGPGPNPLLQNHLLMAFHPPMLYLGFVGWTVPFAFGVAALALGRGGAAWLERTRRWSLLAWSALTAGIVLGGWWSYEVLGWGGFWAWDPVENASLMPWLAGTALLHSAVAQRHRGVLQGWNVSLAVMTFALTILGTFLTRSGVVASVHSFTQSTVGPALLGFFVAVLAGGFGLFAARGHRLSSPRRLDSLASREGAFVVNNLLLSVFLFTVLLGTTYPIFVEAASGAELSVGRPFFDRMAVPLATVLLVAMGIGPVLPYRLARPAVAWERLRVPLLAGLAAGAGLVAAGVRNGWVVVLTIVAMTVAASTVRQLAVAARPHGRGVADGARRGIVGGAWSAARRNPGFWGGQVSHLGVALVAVAIAVSANLSDRATLDIARGESAAFAGYRIAYLGVFEQQEPLRTTTAARLEVSRGGEVLEVLRPRIDRFRNQVQAVGAPSVRTTAAGDLYTTLRSLEADRVVVDVYRYPLMWLLWAGGLVTAGGAVWSLVGGVGRGGPRPDPTEATDTEEVVVAG